MAEARGEDPQVIVLAYPLPERVRCPRCWMGENTKSRGEFCDPAHLAKHLKKMHPGDTISYKCSVCDYVGRTMVPLRNVKAHFEKEHGVPQEPGRTPSGTPSDGGPSTSRARVRVSSRAATPSPSQPSSAGPSRRRACDSRPPGATSTAPASPAPAPAPTPPPATSSAGARESPTYAAVTAAASPAAGTSSSPVTVAAAHGTRSRTAAAHGASCGSRSAAPRAAAANSLKARPQHAGGSTNGSGPPIAREVRSVFPRNISSGESTRRMPTSGTSPPTTTTARSTTERRRLASVPLEKRSAARPARVSPRTTLAAATPPSPRGGRGDTQRRRETPEGPRPITAGPAARPETRASNSVPVEKSAGRVTLARPPAARGVAERGGGEVRTISPPQRGTPPLRGTPQSPINISMGVPSVIGPPIMPATSLPATLTTCTVTTTVCRSPVMATGVAVGRGSTPSPSPPLTTIPRVASPCEEVRTRPQKTPPPPREEEQRREESAAEEGDSPGAPWRMVRPGRRAGRRLSGGSSGGGSPHPVTSANHLSLIDFEFAGTSGVDPARLGDESGGAAGTRTEEQGTFGHPSVPVGVRGVMGRRPRARVTGGTGANAETPPRAANSQRGGGGHRRRPQRVEAPPVQPSGGRSTAAAAARRSKAERVAARDELAGRAEAVASIADLEEFAASVAAFLGENATGVARGDALGARDHPHRSREARARRGEGDRPGRDGGNANRGPAPAGPPSQSGEARGGWVREATRIQALYRANRRKAVREVLQGPADFCQVPKERVQQYFEGLYCGGEDLASPDAEAEQPDPSSQGEDAACLMDPFTQQEVDRRIRRMTNSAPGPDGLTYRNLRAADPGMRLLTA